MAGASIPGRGGHTGEMIGVLAAISLPSPEEVSVEIRWREGGRGSAKIIVSYSQLLWLADEVRKQADRRR